jgi:hypothetical protein
METAESIPRVSYRGLIDADISRRKNLGLGFA